MLKRHNILLTRASFFISTAEKFESVQEFKVKFLSNYFIANDIHIKIICSYEFKYSRIDQVKFVENRL